MVSETGLTVIGKDGKVTGRIEHRVVIMCVPDQDYNAKDMGECEDPCGVYVRVEYKNWITGNNAEYESPGLWGVDSSQDTDYIREIAKEQFEELQKEFGTILIPFTVADLDKCEIKFS